MGPENSRAMTSRMAVSMLNSDSRRTPLSTPDMAEAAAVTVTMMMMTAWVNFVVSMPKTWARPALACSTPMPRLVARPSSVQTTPKMSTLWPSQPSARFWPNTGTSAERSASGRLWR